MLDERGIQGLSEVLSRGTMSGLLFKVDEPIDVLVRKVRDEQLGPGAENPLYRRFQMQTNGKIRKLSVPNGSFKKLARKYILPLIKTKKPHAACHGGEGGWSVKGSLSLHLPCTSVLSFDLSSVFENVPFDLVAGYFFDLLSDVSHFNRENIAWFLARLCTVPYSEGRRGLPQGSACSPALFNRILYFLDDSLSRGAEQRGMIYTRWIDDMTLSCSHHMPVEQFLGAVQLTGIYFPIAPKKIYYQDGAPIYLLGHRVFPDRIEKNTREDRERNKVEPLDYAEYVEGKNYGPWVKSQ